MIRYAFDPTRNLLAANAGRAITEEDWKAWLDNLTVNPRINAPTLVLLDLRLARPLPPSFAWWFITGIERCGGSLLRSGWSLVVHRNDERAVRRLPSSALNTLGARVAVSTEADDGLRWLRALQL
jgi:hypothetical protein